MVTVEELLQIGKENGASDVHITVGIPPRMRVSGGLITMDYPRLMPPDTDNMIKGIMNERQIEMLNEKGEVTGPTGSGKSTTLASLIDRINEITSAHVITLEDPIEYLHHHKKSMVNQREIGLDSMSYANALRAALREDPDVILVGEMRDLETISTAITAAETGHLVFSTLHTIGAASTIDRIIDVFPPHQQQQIRVQLSMVLESVISQQLIPTTDRQRRVAAFEVMHMTTAIKNLIREAKTFQIDSMIQTSKKIGMITMDDALYELVGRGEITREVAISFAQDQPALERKFGMLPSI